MARRRDEVAEAQRIVPIVLAAGYSARMGHCKALLAWRKNTFLDFICGQLARAGFPRPVVVIPATDDIICRMHSTLDVVWARNAHPEDGMLSSIRAGLAHVPPESAVMICLVDHPAVRVRTYRALARMARPDAIAVPVWQGRRGHPVVFGSAFIDELRHSACREGARSVVHAHPDAVRAVTVCDRGIVCDIDTPEEYAYVCAKYTGRSSANSAAPPRRVAELLQVEPDVGVGAQAQRE